MADKDESVSGVDIGVDTPKETENAENHWADFGKSNDNPSKQDESTEVDDQQDEEPKTKESASEVKLTRRQLRAAERVGIDPNTVTKSMLPLLDANANLQSNLSRVNQEKAKTKSYRQPAEETKPTDDDKEAVMPLKPLATDDMYEPSKFNERFSLLESRITSLQEENERLFSMVESQKMVRANEELKKENEEFDRLFNGLNKESFPQFGEGSIDDFDDNDPEIVARSQLVDEAIAIHERYKNRGTRITLEDAFERALFVLHPEQVRAHESKKVARKTKKGTTIPAPQGKSGDLTLPPEEAAASHWDGWVG